MIAMGMIPGVQIERLSPTDRLLRMYCECCNSADIMLAFVSVIPQGEGSLNLVDQAIREKYPYLKGSKGDSQDQLDKYNKAMKMIKKREKEKEKEKEKDA